MDPATGKFVRFGYPGSSSAANRTVQEGTFGVIQTFWKSPAHGALQLITQYSYLTRSPAERDRSAAGGPKLRAEKRSRQHGLREPALRPALARSGAAARAASTDLGYERIRPRRADATCCLASRSEKITLE